MKKNLISNVLVILLILVMVLSVGCSSTSKDAGEQTQKESEVTNYPEKPITFVCWSSAGSSLDIFMRQLAQAASKELGQNIVVENRTGGSGAVAMSHVNSLPADGYTLLSTTGSMTFSMATGTVPFKPDDFTLLTTAQAEPSSVAVLSDSPIKTLEDFVKIMKEEPNSLTIGGYASGGFHNFVMHRFCQEAGITAEWIPFEGGSDAITALLGGHIDVAFITPSTALSQMEEGKVRLLAISTPERSEFFPDVPTFKELGYDVVEMLWRGIMAKQGIPEEVKEILLDAFNRAFESEEFKQYMTDFVQEDFRVSGDEFVKLVNEELAARTKFAQEIGLAQ